MSRAEAIAADLFDLEHAKAGAKNPKPYRRPWRTGKGKTASLGDRAGRSSAEAMAILRPNGLNGAPGGPVLAN